MRALLTLALLVGVAPAAHSTGLLDFVADKAQSNFTWSGTTSLGTIVGNPTNAFQLDGHQQLTLSALGGPGAKWTGQLIGGDLLVTPDIKGEIPNVLPFLPPLAKIEITNLRLSLHSDPFDVLADGSFTALVSATALSGTLTVTPLVGTPTVIELSGSSSSPGPQTGTLTSAGAGLRWTSPVDISFDFDDPATGISGSLATQGTLNADWSPDPPVIYCTAKTTSSGCTPALSFSGTPSASAAIGFTLFARQVEPKNLGIFFFGRSGPASLPFQGGTLCVQPPITRIAPQGSGGVAPCSGLYSVDFNAWLSANKPALRAPGESFSLQCWFRDPPEPISGTGLTDAVSFVLGV